MNYDITHDMELWKVSRPELFTKTQEVFTGIKI